MQLDEIQTVFSRHLLNKSVDLSTLEATGPFAVEQLMQVYRNNFTLSLSDYLVAVYPVIEALVGEAFFAQLAKAYIREVPLQQAPIESYGDGFSDFVAQCEQTQELPYLADIAALEWAIDRAKLDFKACEFPFSRLESLSLEEQSQLCFVLRSSVVLIDSRFPIVSIWQGVQSGNLDNIDMDSAERALIYCNNESQVQLRALMQSEYLLLSFMSAGCDMQTLAVMEDFQQHLGQFIGDGVISNFYLSSEKPNDQ